MGPPRMHRSITEHKQILYVGNTKMPNPNLQCGSKKIHRKFYQEKKIFLLLLKLFTFYFCSALSIFIIPNMKSPSYSMRLFREKDLTTTTRTFQTPRADTTRFRITFPNRMVQNEYIILRGHNSQTNRN